MHEREVGVSVSSAPSSGLKCLPLSDVAIKASVFQSLEHLLGIFAVGEGTDLDAVELIGGGLLRLGGWLYRLGRSGLLRRIASQDSVHSILYSIIVVPCGLQALAAVGAIAPLTADHFPGNLVHGLGGLGR